MLFCACLCEIFHTITFKITEKKSYNVHTADTVDISAHERGKNYKNAMWWAFLKEIHISLINSQFAVQVFKKRKILHIDLL